MQRYQVVVNGNTYTVTVKSLIGNTAVVDVDGWEFQVAISESEGKIDFSPVVAAATGAKQGVAGPRSSTSTKTSSQPPTIATKKRASALEELGPKKAAVPEVSGEGVVSAHLPGQIVEITVKIGEAVSKGQLVCKMEAMKMVNEVKAPKDGNVKEILVKEQQNVLENQPLMVID